MKKRTYWLLVLCFLVVAHTLGGCAALISKYDQIAFQTATSIKVDSLALMEKATSSYSLHETTVEILRSEVEKAFEYAKGRPKNEIVARQWSIMRDPERNLLGGFLRLWKNRETLTHSFIAEAKTNVALGFDQIIGLESGLIKGRDVK